ncbi:serine-rich protein-like protein [Corchorus olitorius]|uniref:Serine-rich protein-like protein n=1 Tax=Corchorus olitorius TaxID=93759 RepID=A0A1R3FU14_9ROSI|nr:serine-rich protein-like protein [Corchorus olitorius]
MGAESLMESSEKSDPIHTMAAWPTLKKNAANAEEELMIMNLKAKKKKNVMNNKAGNSSNIGESKKGSICICSPTRHAGSFRCHLHRCTSSSQPNSTIELQSHQPQPTILSRFGRASASSPASLQLSNNPFPQSSVSAQ